MKVILVNVSMMFGLRQKRHLDSLSELAPPPLPVSVEILEIPS